jgi:hypothetical protein
LRTIPACARRHRLVIGEDAVQRDPDVPELASLARCASHDVPTLDHAAAQPGPDDGGNRRGLRRPRTEVDLVRVERRGIAVVVVGDRQADPLLQPTADVEAAPRRLGEVGGALGADHTVGARRAGRVEADRHHLRERRTRRCQRRLHGLDHRLDRRVRAVRHPARDLEHTVDEERAIQRQDGRVRLRAAVVDPDDDRRGSVHRPIVPPGILPRWCISETKASW